MKDYGNLQVASLPSRLKHFVVEQNYNKYTAIDQAVWRYVMRQNYSYLKDIAYYPYIEGLKCAGLSIERIPDLATMNSHLKQIGWGAVTVDGFIPPAAFMEFQAYKVLVIASDIRQLEHILYTPAPDIIHESSGHAPIIADEEYARYLQYFGEIGSKALFSKQDFELYESIRKLSILKEMPFSTSQEIAAMEEEVLLRQNNLGEPSEMALLSRLHWWTVEYGLIGTLKNYKIYGAGLLSSIGESVNCMKKKVKKYSYTLEAIHTPFDITTEQPQLFVTPDFTNLTKVLDQFSEGMAYKIGGLNSLKKAHSSGNVCTLVLNSGVQVSGIVDMFSIIENKLSFIKCNAPAAFALNNTEVAKYGRSYFNDGIGFPFGALLGIGEIIDNYTKEALHKLGLAEGKFCSLNYENGWKIQGIFQEFLYHNKQPVLLRWADVQLFDPKNLMSTTLTSYVLPLGTEILSVFNGAADKEAFEVNQPVTVIKVKATEPKNLKYETCYKQIRDIRENQVADTGVSEIWSKIKTEPELTWLCILEMFEFMTRYDKSNCLANEIQKEMLEFASNNPSYATLIQNGIKLALSDQPLVQ